MTNTLQKMTLWAGAALLIGSHAAQAGAQAAAASPTVHNSTCNLAEQSVDDKGRTLIVARCIGDLRGALTLVLDDPQAATLSGEWALNVSYTDKLHPGAVALPDNTTGDPDAAEGEKMVHEGVLHGVIQNGTTSMSAGKVYLLNDVQLRLTGGSMQFAAIAPDSASGSISAIHVENRASSTINLSLTF